MTTRSQFQADWQTAARRGPDTIAAFKASVARQTQEGRDRGGTPCCGTTDIWHRPWGTEGPWEPEGQPAR